MKIETISAPRAPRNYLIIDLESAVVDETAHRRYQCMERWMPADSEQESRRGYKRHEDPLQTPRWCFQSVLTASVMLMAEHADGNLDIVRFETFSAADHDEAGIIASVLKFLSDAPAGTELISWSGGWHDLPLFLGAVLRHKMTLPPDWRWIGFGGEGRVRHVDFARVLTGGSKMKPIHLAEYVAALDIPAKMTAAPFMVTKFIYQQRWDLVAEICEGDVITSALLLARWRRAFDPRAGSDVVEERILRRICELRPDRAYVAELQARRERLFEAQVRQARDDAIRLAPWLDAA